MSLFEHSWDPPGANFAIFQRCHHCFQRIEADIQLCTQFPSRNPPIRADLVIETLFISWCESCAWPSGTWLVFHAAVATAETRHSPPHCLVSVNVQEASMNVTGCNFFLPGGIHLHTFVSYALPSQMPFCKTASLLSSVAQQQNLTEYWREGSTSTAISPTPASDFMGQHNKIGVINFGATLVIVRMRIACWIPKATNTHTEYFILIASPLRQWWHERASVLTF